jgi:hypothetical protein
MDFLRRPRAASRSTSVTTDRGAVARSVISTARTSLTADTALLTSATDSRVWRTTSKLCSKFSSSISRAEGCVSMTVPMCDSRLMTMYARTDLRTHASSRETRTTIVVPSPPPSMACGSANGTVDSEGALGSGADAPPAARAASSSVIVFVSVPVRPFISSSMSSLTMSTARNMRSTRLASTACSRFRTVSIRPSILCVRSAVRS